MSLRSYSHTGRQILMLLVGLWFGLSSPSFAAETIKSFTSDITVLTDGSVDVVETIVVRAEGLDIRRGIFRDIPTELRNEDGSRLRSNLQVVSVHKDGQVEPFRTQSIRDGTRIYIGDADVFLPVGDYTYAIRYTMTRMARRFENHDELYWNATGNFWSFPIKQVNVHVTLPEGAQISELTAYTGGMGQTGTDYRAIQTANNSATFTTTRILSAREGISVVASFEKGALSEPGSVQQLSNFLSDHRDTLFPLFAVFIVLLYNLFAWDAVGRDPKKGTIIPLFHPPKGFSPALIHYVHYMGWKKTGWTAFSAALISLATKNLIEITTEKKKTSFSITESKVPDLPAGEVVVHAHIARRGTLKVNKSNGKSIGTTKIKFIKALETENRKVYFKNNVGYIVFGALLSFTMLIALVFLGIIEPAWLIVSVPAAFGIIILSNLFGSIGSRFGVGRFTLLVGAVIALANIVPAIAGRLSGTSFGAGAIAVISIVAITVVFAMLLRAPTIQGRQIMDDLEGFKLYLETAEKQRLNFSKEPEFSIVRFEKILPYAIALGVEKPWADRLSGELARNALAETQSGYHPRWYHGSQFSTSSLSSDIAAIGAGVSAAMISAQPVSSSSSGGGGGGFSGGGGGGGGGGGW